MSNQEQLFINTLYDRIQKGENIHDLISEANEKYSNSVVIQYYLGYYYDKKGHFDEAEVQFKKCTQLNIFYPPPYFNLVSYLLARNEIKAAYDLASVIFCKKVIDPVTGKRIFSFPMNFQLCALLFENLIKSKMYKKAEKMYLTMLQHVQDVQDKSFIHIVGMKNLCLGLGSIYTCIAEPEKALRYYKLGLNTNYTGATKEETDNTISIDKSLLQGYFITTNYIPMNYKTSKKNYVPFDTPRDVNELYKTKVYNFNSNLNEIDSKIKIGYISPDFNKNAVGLFVTPLLKHFDNTKFSVTCYYTNKHDDEYTAVLKSYPHVTWKNLSHYTDEEAFIEIKYKDSVDILVDLLAMGSGGRLDIIQLFYDNGIDVWELCDFDNGVKIIKHKVEDNDNSFKEWLHEHIFYKHGSQTTLKTIIQTFCGHPLPSRKAAVYRLQVEGYIKNRFPRIDWKYKDSIYDSKRFRGWLHVELNSEEDVKERNETNDLSQGTTGVV